MRRIYPIDIIRRRLLAACTAGAALAITPASAQRRLWIVGYIGAGSAVNDYAWLAAFRKGMADLRHSEGQDYVIDARFGDGMQKVLVSRIDDLVSLKPDVILTPGDGTLPQLLARTKKIPIVFATGYGQRCSATGGPIVDKPYTQESLQRVLLTALGNQAKPKA